MGVKSKIKITTLGEKTLLILSSIGTETSIFVFATPTAIKDYVRGRNQDVDKNSKDHISQKEIETFIKLLEDNKLIVVEKSE